MRLKSELEGAGAFGVPDPEREPPLLVHEAWVEQVEVVLLEPLEVEDGRQAREVWEEEAVRKATLFTAEETADGFRCV